MGHDPAVPADEFRFVTSAVAVKLPHLGNSLCKDCNLMISISRRLLVGLCFSIAAVTASAQDKPNILVIWGDDIGWFNVSAYNHGTSTGLPGKASCSRTRTVKTAAPPDGRPSSPARAPSEPGC
jgi:hypothetical protein